MAKAEVSVVKAGAKAVVKATSGLHPDAALEVLEPIHAATRQGLRKRVLLAARIALMRKAMAAPARVVVVAPPAPADEVLAEVPPAPTPVPPAPKPLPKGRIMSINLDDLSSLLAEPAEPDPKPEAEPSATFAPTDWGGVAAATAAQDGTAAPAPADLPADGDGAEAVMAKPGKASRGRKRGAVVAIKDGAASDDPFAALAELQAAGTGEEVAPTIAMVDPMAAFAEMEAGDSPAPKPLATDPGAAFAALAEAEEAEAKAVVAKAAPAGPDPFAVLAELEAAEDQAVAEIAPRAKAPVIDAGAAFAALDEAQEEEARSIAPAAGKPKPLAIDLSAQFAAMGDED